MSSLISSTSTPSQILQSLSSVYHNEHISDLISLRVTLQRVTSPDIIADPQLQTLLQKLSDLNHLPPSRLNDTLTRRQRLTTLSHGGQTISTSFMSQVTSSITSLPPSTYDDAKLYKTLVLTWSKSRNIKPQLTSKKKKVDRKASKGRKIKYSKIAKLENFTYPVERGGGEDEWMRSMFK
mmetsp:Transcript_23099/g.43410  ORF Transcript_23099/g.43410 Transcript_23099/m.43410 type:complete len:180 (-) Transcript_23099:1837-2376(-)